MVAILAVGELLLVELEGRIGPLKTQSEKAQKFLVLSEEKKVLEIGLWLYNIDKLKEDLRSQEDKLAIAKGHYDSVEADLQEIEELIEKGIPDLNNGFGRKVFEFGEFCSEIFAKYPKIKEYVVPFHPDLQGPLDICELLWGGEMFYAMYDDPDIVHSAMSLITDT